MRQFRKIVTLAAISTYDTSFGRKCCPGSRQSIDGSLLCKYIGNLGHIVLFLPTSTISFIKESFYAVKVL